MSPLYISASFTSCTISYGILIQIVNIFLRIEKKTPYVRYQRMLSNTDDFS